MDYKELITITDAYRALLQAELSAANKVADATLQVECAKMSALASAVIDGKNADVRKQQQEQALSESAEYDTAMARLVEAEHEKALASVEAEHIRAVIGLTKAWLYSQSGIS